MKNPTSLRSSGFVLHSYPYKETSLILETFTRTHGRVAMVAKGAKRGGNNKYALNPFQPVTLDWFGRAELKTLKASEHQQIFPQLRSDALMAAFYANELLLKLAVKDDPHDLLFDAYHDAVASLAQHNKATSVREIETILRRFELTLLAELGYALTLAHEADSDAAIVAEAQYLYVVDRGPIRLTANHPRHSDRFIDPVKLSGKTLQALHEGLADAGRDTADPLILSQAKQLMRRVINHHLGDKALHTRQLIRELK